MILRAANQIFSLSTILLSTVIQISEFLWYFHNYSSFIQQLGAHLKMQVPQKAFVQKRFLKNHLHNFAFETYFSKIK